MQKGDTIRFECVVDQQVHERFIALFNDRNPLHTDEAFARAKGFNGRVMHGNILNGFLSYFIGERLPMKDVIIHSQQINYNLPVYLGDKLTFEATVEEIHESVNAIDFKFHFTNALSKKVARGKIQIGFLA
jgi:3-hydroxybutyryl-CoA dehydratase